MIPKCEYCNNDAIGYVHVYPKNIKESFSVIRVVRFCETHRKKVYNEATIL